MKRNAMMAWGVRVFAVLVVALIIPACSMDGDDGAPGPTGAPGSVDAWSRTGNAGTIAGTNFVGTTDFEDFDIRVNNSRALRIEPTTVGPPNIVGGWSWNIVTPVVQGATIAGGGSVLAGGTNRVTDDEGTVGGGAGNIAGDNAGTLADRRAATVGGGGANTASGSHSTVSGGSLNTASGSYASVPGGAQNTASGAYSFAGGRGAIAASAGSFVWNDFANAGGLTTSAPGQFVALASGGVYFFSNAAATTGVSLFTGSGAWAAMSDRNLKANITPVDGRKILEKVAALPIATWNYTSQNVSIRHMGPMAQDFSAAFKLGESERHISTIDADGVALSAIQGLYAIVQVQETEINALRAEVDGLKKLEIRLRAIEKALGK